MKIFSVSEITKQIKELFDFNPTMTAVFLRGEISNFKKHYSGHCYFTLKDSQATIKVVLFKSRAQFLKFDPKDGMKVIVGGKIAVFERDGQYQLYGEQLIPDGVGELSIAFAQLKEKLEREGLFADSRKKDLPILPKVVGIITSATGAVLRDIITVSKRRHPGVALTLYPVLVQGPEAPEQLVHAVEVFNTRRSVDVIIIGRGGGSIEDLWAFNDERVVRAIAASTIPIVSAVGHQTDFTLTDFVADRRAATPSQAAEIVVPDVRELTKYITTLKDMLVTNIQNVLNSNRLRVMRATESRVLKEPHECLLIKQQLLDRSIQRLEQSMQQIVMAKRHRYEVAAEKLAMLNPIAVLARGYSIVRNVQGQMIDNIKTITVGENVEVVMNDGRINVEVISVQEGQYGKG